MIKTNQNAVIGLVEFFEHRELLKNKIKTVAESLAKLDNLLGSLLTTVGEAQKTFCSSGYAYRKYIY